MSAATPQKHISPFLHRIFAPDTTPYISEGWVYGAQETELYGGYNTHEAVDFAVPLGTPVLAAADGLAIASFEEVRIRYPGNQARSWHGEPIYWGYGLFVAILHANGYVTFYAHLHRLSETLWKRAYVQPRQLAYGDIAPPIDSLKAEDFKSAHTSVSVKAGDVIGYSGITGMGLGQHTYYNWSRNMSYKANDEEHVHFAVSELPAMTGESVYIDPFDIYGYADAYPSYTSDWTKLTSSLWLS